eukprot:SAG22_NODE_1244_length_5021_cov_16.855547_2_plen_86_part_00
MLQLREEDAKLVAAEKVALERRGFAVVRGKSPADRDTGGPAGAGRPTQKAKYNRRKFDQMLDYYDTLGAALSFGTEFVRPSRSID